MRRLVSLTELSGSVCANARDTGESNRGVEVKKLERRRYRCRMGQLDREL